MIIDVVSKSIPDDAGEDCTAGTVEFIVPLRCRRCQSFDKNDEVRIVSSCTRWHNQCLGDNHHLTSSDGHDEYDGNRKN